MPVCRLAEYTSRFPIGTEVVYTPAGGLPRVRGRIAEAPAPFGKLVETCVVRLDNGMFVPCQELIALSPSSAAPADVLVDWNPRLSC